MNIQKLLGLVVLLTLFGACQNKAEQKQLLQAEQEKERNTRTESRFEAYLSAQRAEAHALAELSERETLTAIVDERNAQELKKLLVQNKAEKLIPSDSLIAGPGSAKNKGPKEPVRHAALLLAVRDYDKAKEQIQKLVQEQGGFLGEEQELQEEGRIEMRYSIALPPNNLQNFVKKIQDLALLLRQKRIWEEDYTSRFVDLESRLQSKFLAKNRLEALLTQAKTINDVLPVQRELDELNADLEGLTRMSEVLSTRQQYSRIDLNFYQDLSLLEPVQADFSQRINQGFEDGLYNFKEGLVTAAQYWVYIAFASLFLLVALLARRKAKQRERQFQEKLLQSQEQLMLLQQKK